MTTLDLIKQHADKTMMRIADAAAKHDVASVTALSKIATELEEMRKTVLNVEQRLQALQTASMTTAVPPSPSSTATNQKIRELAVEVSQGMINQNLLTLTEHVRRGKIRAGDEMLIEAQPSGERFRTELMLPGNKLQERGAIGRFYKDAHVREGDFVILTEIAPKRWTLHKASPGQFRGRNDLSSW